MHPSSASHICMAIFSVPQQQKTLAGRSSRSQSYSLPCVAIGLLQEWCVRWCGVSCAGGQTIDNGPFWSYSLSLWVEVIRVYVTSVNLTYLSPVKVICSFSSFCEMILYCIVTQFKLLPWRLLLTFWGIISQPGRCPSL